jgi:hypothetical protein
MPSDFRDRGVMLMVTDNPDNFFRDDEELSRQYNLSTVTDHNALVVNGYDYLNRNLNESNDFDWAKDVEPLYVVGDVFHTRLDFTPKDLNAEITFEIYDISPDGKWVRFKHHKGSMYKGTYIDVDKINSETISRGWDKVGYNGANSIEADQVLKNITTGFWKKVEVPGYLDLHPEKKDEIIKLGTNINESDGFDWIKDIPEADEYRFFDMYVCGDNQYDEETGEDECLDGGSYFLKIPKHEVEEIWNLSIGDVGGPGDEGAGVIEWGVKNDKFDPYEFSFVEYVMEISQEEYCREAWSWSQDVCGDFLNESNDFEWAKDDIPPFYTLEWKEHPLSISVNKIWDDLDIGGEFTPQFNTFKDLKHARKEYPNGKWISVVSGPNWIPSAFEDDPTDPEDINSDRLGDRFEVFGSEMEEPEIMTKDEINQYMEDLESSHNINESKGFDWADEVQGKPQVMDIFRVKGTRYTWTVVEELDGDRFMFKIRPKPDSGSAFQELTLNAVNNWLETGNWVPEGREKYWYNLR